MFLIKKYNLTSIRDKYLLKITSVKNGEIISEVEYIESKKVSYNFEFTISEVWVKSN